MHVFRSLLSDSSLQTGCVATIGNFDGIHRGHQALLQQLQKKARQLQLPMVVIIFEPQPREFFLKNAAPPRLSSLRDKLLCFREWQVDKVYCLHFNQTRAAQSAEDFIQSVLLNTLKIKYLLIGEDFRFGYQRLGDIHLLQRMTKETACQVDTYPDFILNEERISSTKIRAALQQDKLEKANEYLGHPYGISARVVHGEQLGRQWGVPTANMHVYQDISPLQGIYCVHVKQPGKPLQPGVAYVGRRPTLDNRSRQCLLEVHLFDVDETLYRKRLQVFFLHKLRDEVKFASLDELIAAIHADVAAARAYFAHHYPSNRHE